MINIKEMMFKVSVKSPARAEVLIRRFLMDNGELVGNSFKGKGFEGFYSIETLVSDYHNVVVTITKTPFWIRRIGKIKNKVEEYLKDV